MSEASRRERVVAAYNPPRWLRAGLAFRCEGIDTSCFADGHRDIRRGDWLLRRAELADDGDIVWRRACAACGLALHEASRPRAKLRLMAVARLAPLRVDEERDLARCRGEKRLLVALLRDAFACLSSQEPREREAARSWFELGNVGPFPFRDAAHYVGLDAELLRREAERVCFRRVAGEKQKGTVKHPFQTGVARPRQFPADWR